MNILQDVTMKFKEGMFIWIRDEHYVFLINISYAINKKG